MRYAVLLLTALISNIPNHASQAAIEYDRVSRGTAVISAGDLVIKVLVEQANLGSSEVEVGEITFPAGYESRGHSHGALEIFYIVQGRMNHIVNGKSHVLEPGMVGIVRSGDTVTHAVLDNKPLRAVVIWAPGGEADRLRKIFPNVKELTAQ